MIMTRGPLCELVPIENAAMADRTVIEWDKDDIDALGILKVDCLALGMLTCISKCFKLLNASSASDGPQPTDGGPRPTLLPHAGWALAHHGNAEMKTSPVPVFISQGKSPPLPLGEGRGEGSESAGCHAHACAGMPPTASGRQKPASFPFPLAL